ncbi:hypothetical protein [Burkholderia sp. Leaf177]|uniref:hypothetical protein n=1 Tax=Burkholderia sp. Leaf177 TaxID=1736287 RepID=UPI0009E9ACE6|nr:hypothetical protein [Burkholderia sp. Leaf177]
MKALAIALKSAGLIAIVTGAITCAAQNAPTPPDVAPPPVAGNAPPPVIPRAAQPSTIASVTTGVIKRYLINPEGDIDGLLLGDNSLVRFPPHVGASVAAIAAPGDSIRVNGASEANGVLHAQQVTNTRSGQTAMDQPPAADRERPLPPSLRGVGLVKLDATGRVLKVTTAPRGEPDGVLLADGTVIKLTPPGARQFPSLLQPGALVAAHGYGTRNRFGQSLQATSFGTPGNLTPLYGRVD